MKKEALLIGVLFIGTALLLPFAEWCGWTRQEWSVMEACLMGLPLLLLGIGFLLAGFGWIPEHSQRSAPPVSDTSHDPGTQKSLVPTQILVAWLIALVSMIMVTGILSLFAYRLMLEGGKADSGIEVAAGLILCVVGCVLGYLSYALTYIFSVCWLIRRSPSEKIRGLKEQASTLYGRQRFRSLLETMLKSIDESDSAP